MRLLHRATCRMAEVPLPTPTDNPVPSTDIRDAVYAGAMLDKVVTSTEPTYIDRLGGEHYTVDGMKVEGDKVVEETRQNLIPLSRQYMTLAAAQADIANIPVNSTTYVRSPDGSALADEYMNVAGTLTATGRKMPSQTTVDANTSVITGLDLDRVDVSPASLGTGQYYQISTGTIATTTDTNWAASAPVSVAGYKRLILSGSFLYRAAVAPLLFVDSAGTVISVQSLGIPMSSDNVWSSRSEVQVDIPAAAVSALISTYAESAVAVYAAAQAFRESGVALSASKTKKRVLNWIPNTYMNIATGVLTSSSDTFAAARVPVAPGDVFTLSCSLKGAPNQIRLLGFFDSNETLIGTFYPGTGSGTVSTITNLTFRVPKNTASMVITAYSPNSSTVLMQASVFDRAALDIQTAADTAGNLAKSSVLPFYSGRYWKNTNGALTVVNDAQFCAFYPVQVTAGDVYRIKSNLTTGNPSLVSMVVFKGANGELVGTAQPAPGSGAFAAADITVTVPSGAVLMLLTAYSPYIDIVYQGSAVEKSDRRWRVSLQVLLSNSALIFRKGITGTQHPAP